MTDFSRVTAFAGENGIRFKTDVMLKNITTFRIGGNAKVILYPADAMQAALCVRFLGKDGYTVLGNGSNVLAPDEGLEKVIIKTDMMKELTLDGECITAGAGVMLSSAAALAARNSLTGMERLFGIPGSIGGAVIMNAGAYGGEMSQIVEETLFVDGDGNIRTVTGAEHRFGYRKSCFELGDIVCGTKMRLQKGNSEEIRSLTDELMKRRRTSQPLEYPSAGSVFKRPEGYFAGKLIQDCDLKGVSVGGAQVSLKHAGFIVNTGDATAKDVKDLIKHIQQTVFDKFGVRLETEIRML